ncbi:MAG: hypothetical protein HYV08_16990 [Deltaproteobacteria bacterium]|nr:hypothetical protein [Deltaproteobacteria bacterium]MBI3078125.1 hypothetical protein [Deltaproteobacteria bacterium]
MRPPLTLRSTVLALVPVLVAGCAVLPSRSGWIGRDDEAIALVRGGAPSGQGATIAERLAGLFQAAEAAGTEVEEVGWYAAQEQASRYRVRFIARWAKARREWAWEADLRTQAVRPLNRLARELESGPASGRTGAE